MRLLYAIVVVALVLAASRLAAAEPKYAHGYYAEAGLGTGFFLGDAGKYIAPGPSFALRSGYDLWPWFSVGGRLSGGFHEGDVPPPPEEEYFQLLEAAGEARLTLRIRRVALFATGSLGFGYITTNILDRVGVTEPDSYLSPSFGVGGGIDYHTQNRHFSFGLTGDYAVYSSFDSAQGIAVRLYLRYTK
jgi:hypothetical protein